jgi:serine/threonine protein kinase/class 3 adenylate cyclase
MGLGDFQLLAQVGAGRDAVAYRAEPRVGGPAVELRRLTRERPDGQAESGRPAGVLKRLILAGRLDHPNIRRVVALGPDDDPPWVALQADDRPALAEGLGARPALEPAEALRLVRALASALAAAHRLGLAVGKLDPWTVRGDGPRAPRIDPTGLDAGTDRPPREAQAQAKTRGTGRDAFRAPELRDGTATGPTTEADAFALGALASWLLTGEPAPGDWPASLPPDLGALVRSLVQSDLTLRPTAAEAERRFAELAGGLGRPGPSAPVGRAELGETIDVGRLLPFTVEVDRAAARPAGEATPPTQVDPWRAGPEAATVLDPNRDDIDEPQGVPPAVVGRFRLVEKLGEGGMGAVYKALDEADDSVVALKLLRPEFAARPNALQRFRKEARLLAQVRNPYVTNLLEVNEDRGLHYLVMEYVAGRSLDRVLVERGKLDEPTALAVAADVARGLTDAHRLGIVHRDVKPANILLVDDRLDRRTAPGADPAGVTQVAPAAPAKAAPEGPAAPRVKLSDFGLARHTIESESLAMTRAGAVMGTPSYMAPEQGAGGAVDVQADVYALGATLFHLLAGRPPFEADDWRAVVAKHQNEPPPPLGRFHPGASEGLARVVEKALAKSPSARYADASAFLDDLERLRRGEPTGLVAHPALPAAVATDDALKFDFTWELDSPPRRLWPFVSNTDRLDRALGFGAVRYTMRFDPEKGVRRFLEGNKAGMVEEGEELPYEWVEGRRLGVYREYTRGPFRWVLNVVEMAPRPGGGTSLTHRLRIAPRGRLVRLGSRWGVGSGLKRELEKVYRRIDASLAGRLTGGSLADPFERPDDLPEPQRRRLDEQLGRLVERGVDPAVAERLGEFVASAPGPELSRIRPIALARRLGLNEDAVTEACLHGASVGLLVLYWDLLCPICRVSSDMKDTLRALEDHGRCEACQVDYALDFARSVELVFRSHPQVREADTNVYCAAGPNHMPHVVAQVQVQPGERLELELELTEGDYRLRGPQLGWALDLRVRPGAAASRRDVSLTRGPEAGAHALMAAGGQVLGLDNDGDRPLLVRVERTAPRDDALTAARASALALFRELFPAEVLAPGRLVNVAGVALLVTALDRPAELYEDLGDARAFAALHEQFRRFGDVVRDQGGAVVKTVGEGVLAAFPDPDAAVAAAFALPGALAGGEGTAPLAPRLCASVHAGPAMAATLNDHLDYFGVTVYQAAHALLQAAAGTVVLTEPVAADPRVAERLDARGLTGDLIVEPDPGPGYGPLLRLTLGAGRPEPPAVTLQSLAGQPGETILLEKDR